MPAPVKRTIRGVQGDDWFALGFRWTVPDVDGAYYLDRHGNVVEIPVDVEVDPEDRLARMTIASARMQFRAKVSDADPIISLDEDNGLDLTELGAVYPSLTPEQTEALTGGVWDLEVTSAGNQVKTLASGPYIFTEDVTR